MREFEKSNSFGKKSFSSSKRRESDDPKRRSFDSSRSKSFGKSRDSEGRFDRKDSDRRGPRNTGLELFRVVCDKCGESCEVPFKPTNTKPVYCRECFKKNESSSDNSEKFAPRRRSRSDESFESRDNVSSEDIVKINRKLDRIMKALNID
jgi:CxxC-x17-CxxC domain-containing protein